MLTELIGPPQIAAALVLGQRGLEELYSARNTGRMLARGGYEVGRAFYPVVATTHLAWIAGLAFLIDPGAPVSVPLVLLYLALQVVRYWVIASLGPYWTHRIITLDGAPVVRSGPYRYLRHPNYAVTMAETLILPAAFGAYALALIMTGVWVQVLRYKILLEDEALQARFATATKAGNEVSGAR
jgi:methyltransferase